MHRGVVCTGSRSGRSRSSRALNVAGNGLDEDEEEFFPDVERDAFRRRRALKVFCTLFGIGLIFVLFVGTIVAYFMLQPKPPTFQYEVWERLICSSVRMLPSYCVA